MLSPYLRGNLPLPKLWSKTPLVIDFILKMRDRKHDNCLINQNASNTHLKPHFANSRFLVLRVF